MLTGKYLIYISKWGDDCYAFINYNTSEITTWEESIVELLANTSWYKQEHLPDIPTLIKHYNSNVTITPLISFDLKQDHPELFI